MIKVTKENYHFFLITAIEDYKISQAKLAKYLGINQTTLGAYYRREKYPGDAFVKKLSPLAGIDQEMADEIKGKRSRSARRNYDKWQEMLDKLNKGDTEGGLEIAKKHFRQPSPSRNNEPVTPEKKSKSRTRVRAFRRIFDLNRDEVGKVIGASRTTVGNIEKGRRTLAEDEWEKIKEYAERYDSVLSTKEKKMLS